MGKEDFLKEYSLEELVYSDYPTKNIVIRLDLIFNRPDIAFINNFRINQRSYYNIFDLIVKEYQLIIKEYPKFLDYLLNFRYYADIMKDKKKALSIIDDIFNDKELFKFVHDFVENSYTLNLDKEIDVNTKYLEYAITDDKNKIILQSSIIMRLLLPIVCNAELNMSKKDIYLLFVKTINTITGSKQTYNKLTKFIELRVKRTIYSDKIIWNYLKKHSVDPDTEIRNLTQKIISSIITKLDYNTKSTSFLEVVLREQLKHKFTYNNPLNVKSIKNAEQELEEKEKLEIHLLKEDPTKLLIEQISIEQKVKDVTIPKEFEYLTEIRNQYTSIFLEIYYDKEFNALFATPVQRAKLILKMKDDLQNLGYELIPKLLISDIKKNERRMNNRKKMADKILSSKKYNELAEKYKDVKEIFETKRNPVLELVALKNYKFIIDEKEIEFPIEELSKEILDLII